MGRDRGQEGTQEIWERAQERLAPVHRQRWHCVLPGSLCPSEACCAVLQRCRMVSLSWDYLIWRHLTLLESLRKQVLSVTDSYKGTEANLVSKVSDADEQGKWDQWNYWSWLRIRLYLPLLPLKTEIECVIGPVDCLSLKPFIPSFFSKQNK